jgi:hypothetical protein
MNRTNRVLIALTLLVGPMGMACGEQVASDLTVERLPEVQPNLPAVPTIPPPPHEVQYGDSSYSVYGLRRRMANTMDTQVEVTGYIVEIYVPPVCPEGETCPPAAAPHMWIADTPTEADRAKRLTVVGYAENQAQIDEAVELAQRGRTPEVDPTLGIIPIPTDFGVGAKVKVSGRFARVSGTGFNISDGLLEYAGHTTIEPAPEAAAPAEE